MGQAILSVSLAAVRNGPRRLPAGWQIHKKTYPYAAKLGTV